MNEYELKERTKQFALQIIKLADTLPNTISGRAIAGQLIRAAMSVGANYRAACRGRSKAEFIAKLGIVAEEADECSYWLELIIDGGLLSKNVVGPLVSEADELTAIMVSSIQTSKCNQKSQIKNQK